MASTMQAPQLPSDLRRVPRRWAWGAAACVVLAGAAAALAWRVPVSDPVIRSQPYRLTQQVRLAQHSLDVCITAEISGTARATLRTSLLGTAVWSAAGIDEGSVRLALTASCDKGAAPAEVRSVRIVQNWAIGSASVTEPRATSFTGGGPNLSQYNSGSPIDIEGGSFRGRAVCLSPRIRVDVPIQPSNNVDEGVATVTPAFPDVCLTR